MRYTLVYLAACTCLTTTVSASAVQSVPGHNASDTALDFDSTTFQRLEAWLRKEGAVVSPFMQMNHRPVRGVETTRAVAAGSILLHLPPHLVLSGAAASKNGPGCFVKRLLQNCSDKVSNHSAGCQALRKTVPDDIFWWDELEIVTFLTQRLHTLSERKGESNASWPICEKGGHPANYFDSYVATLPSRQALQSHPVFSFSEGKCRAALNGTSLAKLLDKRHKLWIAQWAALSSAMPQIREYGLKTFLHAKALFMTRAFSERSKPGGPMEPVLAPLADMLNMDAKKLDAVWNDANMSVNGFTLSAAVDVRPRSELLDTYGDKPNIAMYATYGFFLQNSLMEPVPLRLRPFPSEANASVSLQVDRILSGFPTSIGLLQLHTHSSTSKLSANAELPSILALSRAIFVADTGMATPSQWSPTHPLPSLKFERRVIELLSAHVEAQVKARAGHAALAALRTPLEFSESMTSASCEQYARFTLEPYGALLDFAEDARDEINVWLGEGPQRPSTKHENMSPPRKMWASYLLQAWKHQLRTLKSNKDLKSASIRSFRKTSGTQGAL